MNYRVELNQQLSSSPTYRLLFLDNQDQPIGHATGELRQYTTWYNGQPYFFLGELVVADQTLRQQGLGSQLLKEIEMFARQEGACWIRGQFAAKSADYMNTPIDERSLKAFWSKNGYGIKREIYDESIRFWKPLQQSASKSKRSLSQS